MNFQKIILMTTIVCCHQIATAQTQEKILEGITITANQTKQSKKETGRNIQIIDGSLFNKIPGHSIDDLLKFIPGIEIQQRGPQGSQSDISMRGSTFQQVLIVFDGVKMNEALTGHFNLYLPVNFEAIDHIEILKGAAASIWGSEAVGGVIHVISKAYTNTNKTPALTASLEAGSYGQYKTGIYLNHAQENSSLSGGLSLNNSNGQPLKGTSGFFKLSNYNAQYSLTLKKQWRMLLTSAADIRNFNAQNYYTSFSSDTASENVKSNWNQISLSKETSANSWHIDLVSKYLYDQYWYRPSAIPNQNKSKLALLQAYRQKKIFNTSKLTFGAQVQKKSILSNDRGNHNNWHGAVYSVVNHPLFSTISLSESVRADWDQQYGFILNPQVTGAWTKKKTTVRMVAGSSFRDADFTERFNNYNKKNVSAGRIGNPNLGAEKSWNYELGIDTKLSSNLSIQSSVFLVKSKGLIDWVPTPYADMPRTDNLIATGSYALAKNSKAMQNYGAELDLFYAKKYNDKVVLNARAGIIYNQFDKKNIAGYYLAGRAKLLANSIILLQVGNFNYSVSALYKQRDPQYAAAIGASLNKEYLLIGTKIKYDFAKTKASCFVQVENIANKQVSDLLGAQLPGRWFSGGFQITLHP
jgi:iron complex outermembrane receptor protein